ncbi:MAG: VRR-NUC domain-containing protein [Prevotellaceae bacterium]|jgi:hypothetical protein|nr:VRR-NUC domain-containing protein [Prevotellaceae bacterium]
MNNKEHNIQVACVNWFRYQYPKHIIYAVPNGGQRNCIVAAKLKAEGVLAGIPDLHIPEPHNNYHGLYVEMKTDRNKLTKKQISMIEKLRNKGYKCEVCYSFDEFVNVINDYLK